MTNYKLNESKMFADVTDGIAIIINSETGLYYGLNELGTAIYENLANGASLQDIITCLKSIGAPADIENKVNGFVHDMTDKEILIESAASTAEVKINKEMASRENFALSIKEYNDAQELLLADPIHEVKEETGWTPEKDSIGYTREETIEREKKSEE